MKLKIALIFVALVIGAIGIGLVLPNYYYHQVVNMGESYDLYKINNFKANLATPGELIGDEEGRVDNPELWRKFQVRDVLVPLPIRHPLYLTSPIIKKTEGTRRPEIGMRILKPDGRELAKILFMDSNYLNPKLDSQELFKIPVFKSRLAKINKMKLWEDLFTKDLTDWEINYGEMVYNLFLLDLRHRFLPKKVINFHLSTDKKFALIELRSENLDYRTELVLDYSGGLLLSYLIVTDKQTEGALELRNYFLQEISMQPGSSRLSKIIYQEYSALSYQRRIDLEGLTYLFSAWSHDIENKDYIRTMIENLERGSKTSNYDEQLRELYVYAYQKYETTFTETFVEVKDLPEDVKLLRNLELEKQKDIRVEKIRNIEKPKATIKKDPENSFFNKLKRSKEKKNRKYKKVKID